MKRKYLSSDKNYIYIISNPSFPGWLKIGRSKDPELRLRSYQTYDPNKGYKMEFCIKVRNSDPHEAYFKDKYESGEWLKQDLSTLISIIKMIEGLE